MSYKDGCHSLFLCTNEEKQEIWKQLGLKESGIKEDIDMILEWFKKQPHLVGSGLPDRRFLERMLIAAKGSREKTIRRLDNFYSSRLLLPQLIQNRPEYIDSTKDLWSFYTHMMVPKLFELKRIVIAQITDPNPNNFDFEIMLKNSIMISDVRMSYDYMLADIWVVDLTKTCFSHLLRVNPMILSKVSRMFFDGYGIRVFRIHALGAPSFAAQLHQLFSKYVNPKIMNRVMFHDAVEDLHKHIPKEYLPVELGGQGMSLKDAKGKMNNIFKSEETKDFLAKSSKQISDETKRPKDFMGEDYLPGTFKKLELD